MTAKDLARMLSIMSAYFGDKKMKEADIDLRKKLEVMHKSELEWMAEVEEDQKELEKED
jgi:hypothetical protein